MALDFSGQNLRGRNFKGRKDLAGANFSYADIRGAKFTNINLTGANFSHAKGGVQLYSTILLILILWFLSGLSGVIWYLNGFFVLRIFNTPGLENLIGILTCLILLIGFFTIYQGIEASLKTFSATVAITLIFALTLIASGAFVLGFVGVFVLAVAVAGAFALVENFILAVATAAYKTAVMSAVSLGVVLLLISEPSAVM